MQLRAALITADAPALVLIVGVQGDMTLPPGGPAAPPQVAQLVRVPLEGVHHTVGLRWLRTAAGLSLACLGSSADKPSALTPPAGDAPRLAPASALPNDTAGPAPADAAAAADGNGDGGGDAAGTTTAAAAAAAFSDAVANGDGGSADAPGSSSDGGGGGGGGGCGGGGAAAAALPSPPLAGMGSGPAADGGSRLLHCQFLPPPPQPQDAAAGGAPPPPLGYLMQPAVTLPPLAAGASGNPLQLPFHGSCAAVVTTRGIAVIDTECRSVALPAQPPSGAPTPPIALAFSPNGCCLCAVYPPTERAPAGRPRPSHVLVLPVLEPLPMTSAHDLPPPGAPLAEPPQATSSGEAEAAAAPAAPAAPLPGGPQQPDTPASGAVLAGHVAAPAGSGDQQPDDTTATGAPAPGSAEAPPELDPVVKVAAARAAWGMLVAHSAGDVVLFCRGLWGSGGLLPGGRASLQAALRLVDVLVQRYPVYTRMAYALAADRFKAQVLAGLPDEDALVTRVDAMVRLVVWDMEAVAHLTWTVEDSSTKPAATTDRIALRLLPPETLEHTMLPWLAYIPQVAGLMVQCVAAWVARHKAGAPLPQRDWMPFVRLLPDLFFTKRLTAAITFWTTLYSHPRIKERMVAVAGQEEVRGMERRMAAAKSLLHVVDQLAKRAQAPLPAAETLAGQLLTELRQKHAAQEGRPPAPGQMEAAVAAAVNRAREGECCMALLQLLNLPANASAPDLKEIKDLLRRQLPHAMREEQQKRSTDFMWALHDQQQGLALHYYRVGAPVRAADLEPAKALDSLPPLPDGMWQQAAVALGLLQPHRLPPAQLIAPTAAAFQRFVATDQLPPPPPFARLADGEQQGQRRPEERSRKRWRDDLDSLLHLGGPAPPRHALDALTRKPLAAADMWAYETVDGTAAAVDVEGLLRAATASSHVDHIRRAWLAAAPTTGALWKRVRLGPAHQRHASAPGAP